MRDRHNPCHLFRSIFGSRFDDAYFLDPSESGKADLSESACREVGEGGNARDSPSAVDKVPVEHDERGRGKHETCEVRPEDERGLVEGIDSADPASSCREGGNLCVDGRWEGAFPVSGQGHVDLSAELSSDNRKCSKRPRIIEAGGPVKRDT